MYSFKLEKYENEYDMKICISQWLKQMLSSLPLERITYIHKSRQQEFEFTKLIFESLAAMYCI